jgi:L-malate glycosyltransferase
MRMSSTLVLLAWPWLSRMVGIPLLAGIIVVAAVGRALRRGRKARRPANRRVRLMIVGGFFNQNWFRSHILPLVAAQSIDRVFVVTHEPLFPSDKVTYDCPPRWFARLTGRGMAKTLWFFWAAYRRRPDVLMGYHIMPNAVACLVAAALWGGKAIYQMTGGPVQILGGGYASEGGIVRHLGRPSFTVEVLLRHLVRQFDCVIARGTRAKEFVLSQRLCRHCVVITGSVDTDLFTPGQGAREYDLINVSRLVPQKGLEYFLALLSSVAKRRPAVRAAVVGDGPLLEDLRRQASDLGIAGNVEFLGKRLDVADLLRHARLFVLTSPSEGMSIAMLEAMSSGLTVVVADVGELRDVVENGENGFLIRSDAPQEAVNVVNSALDNPERLVRIAENARTTALSRASVLAIARQWDVLLRPPSVEVGDT